MRELIKRRGIRAVVVATVGAILLTGFWLTPGFSANFLTKKTAKALFFTKTKADKRFLAAEAETRVTASNLTWRDSNPANNVTFTPGPDGTVYQTGPADTDSAVVAPTLPTVVAGRPMQLVGVNACYSTPNSTLTGVQVGITDTATNNTTSPVTDATDRDDDECRDYLLPSPETLDPTDTVHFTFQMSFPGGGGNLFIARRATFILQPSS